MKWKAYLPEDMEFVEGEEAIIHQMKRKRKIDSYEIYEYVAMIEQTSTNNKRQRAGNVEIVSVIIYHWKMKIKELK